MITTVLLILIIVDFMIVAACVDNDNPIGGLITILGLGAIYHFCYDKNFILEVGNYISQNAVSIIAFSILYLILGIIWSFVKFYLFVKKEKAKGREKEDVSIDKERVITWMMFFPVSILLYLIKDALIQFYEFIQEKVSGVYIKILNKVYGE